MVSSGLLHRSAAGIHRGRTHTWVHGLRCPRENGVGSSGHERGCGMEFVAQIVIITLLAGVVLGVIEGLGGRA